MPSSSAGQEDGVPLEALGAVVGQELDAGRRPAGLDLGPPLDLGEERRHVRRGIGPGQVLGELEERDDRAVAFAPRPRRRARCRGGRRARARRPPRAAATSGVLALRRGRARAATRIARRTSGRAKNRSPRTWNGIPAAPSAASMAGSWAFVRTRIAIAPCAVPARASARIAAVIPASSASSVAKPADLGPRSRPSARHEALRRPRRDAGRALVGRGPAGREDAVGERQDLGRRAVVGLEPHDPRVRVALPRSRSGSRSWPR